MRTSPPGAPLPFGVVGLYPETIGEVGDFDGGNGVRISLTDDTVIFAADLDGTQIHYGIRIMDILEAIQKYNKKHES